MDRNRRQQAIVALIESRAIGTQAELKAQLDAQGISTTQSSLSRDLEELGVIKHRGAYAMPRSAGAPDRTGLLDLLFSGDTLIVAKCRTGMASPIAVAIDRAALPEVAGTIAGDDTVFIALKAPSVKKVAMKALWALFRQSG